MTDSITRLKLLKPSRFNMKIHPDKNTLDGFIAHEVGDIVPNSVIGEKDALNEDGTILPQSLDYSKFTPLLTGALQEAITRIETLEAVENDSSSSNAALEARILALESA